MKWFRFYHEAYRNPKVQEMRPELFKFWVNFLCVASESETRGTIPSEAHLRLALGLTKPTTRRYVSELEALSLLHRSDDGALTPHDWDTLQPEGDDAALRKRRQREKTCGNQPDEMSRDMSRDKNVTSCDSHAGAFLEREGEGEKESVCVSRPHAREGDDLRDWEEALAELQGDPDLKLIGGMLGESADVPSIRRLEGWRFVHAARVIRGPGKRKTWEYFVGIATKASRREYEAWRCPPAEHDPAFPGPRRIVPDDRPRRVHPKDDPVNQAWLRGEIA